MAEETGSSGSGTDPGTDTSSQSGDQSNETLSPEALRAKLTRAREEAAKYRVRAREFGDDEQYNRAKEALAAAEKAEQEKKTEVEKLTEEKERLLYQASSAENTLIRLRVALGAGIDSSQVDEFAGRLQGENEDELKADAGKLAKFFQAAGSNSNGGRRGDPSQGAGSDSTSSGDPLLEAINSKLGISH